MKNGNLPTKTLPEDMEKSRSWIELFLTKPESLPFSFIYDGCKVSGIPILWNPTFQKRRIDANLIETVFEGNDTINNLNIRMECLEYKDYPVIEWIVWFTNKGSEPTPLIKDILALDGNFEGTLPVLHHCNGDYCSEDGYTPIETAISEKTLRFAPNGGRPCDGAFPYYRIQFEGHGLTMAIGWPAQWSASFNRIDDGVHVTACQEKTNLRLMPGESIRTPRMTIMFWTGNTTRAINLWRSWYREHIFPKPNGRPLKTMLACAGTDDGEEFTNANEENQIRYMNKFKELGFKYDVWWIDAGWYPCKDENGNRRWWRTGTWEPDPERFPNGLAKVSKNAEENGASLLVWFEPERVYAGSKLDIEHPEWLLKTHEKPETNPNRLLNLGNPECRRWLTDKICSLIKDNGIKIYRQDFNFPPLQYWRDNDAEDRQGINENFHVQGYLQFWDELLMRNPGLWIDSCSSGGRRNDLETMRRSVPLHYTDYGYGNHPVKLAFHHTLYSWIPYFKECTLSWDVCKPGENMRFDKQVDSFSFHCGMAPMMFATLDIRRNDYDFALAVKMIDIWRKASDYILHGDYYPLTPFSKSNEKWLVWQFDIPEIGKGLIQSIRFANCPDESIKIYPKSFNSDQTYIFENPETKETIEISGSELTNYGFTFKQPKRSGAIWFYKAKEA